MLKRASCICENCKYAFFISIHDKKRGRGRFCGKSCAASGKNNSSYKHGQSTRNNRTKEYDAWAHMIQRCYNANYQHYSRYGGRGITVCDEWLHNFEQFMSDMGKSPSRNHSVDRINNNLGYSPSNCKWSTKKEQASNKSDNIILTMNGISATQEEWGRKTGLSGLTILKRLKRGWNIEKSLTTPNQRKKQS